MRAALKFIVRFVKADMAVMPKSKQLDINRLLLQHPIILLAFGLKIRHRAIGQMDLSAGKSICETNVGS